MRSDIKTIGSSGQISLGKENAGRTVIVDEIEEGVWIVKAAQVIPESELWLHTPEAKDALDRGLAWDSKHEPKPSNLKEIEKKIKKLR